MSKHVRLSCRRCNGPKLAGMGEMFCASCKPIAAAERKEKTRQANIRHKRKTYVPKPRKVRAKVVKPVNKVPTDIRQAWAKAHPNSIMRRKFPTPKSLQEHNWEDKAA